MTPAGSLVAWPFSQAMLVQATENALRQLVGILAGDGRTGGVLTVLSTSAPLHQSLYGSVAIAKVERYRRLSMEKAIRLQATAAEGRRSSFDTRNPNEERFGGAILANAIIFSFSGLTEEADSALTITVARELGQLSLPESVDLRERTRCADMLTRMQAVASLADGSSGASMHLSAAGARLNATMEFNWGDVSKLIQRLLNAIATRKKNDTA